MFWPKKLVYYKRLGPWIPFSFQ